MFNCFQLIDLIGDQWLPPSSFIWAIEIEFAVSLVDTFITLLNNGKVFIIGSEYARENFSYSKTFLLVDYANAIYL